jgi:ribonuclease G
MSAEILCTVAPGETRIALIEAGRAVEIFIERHASPGVVGNIYLGRVSRMLTGMEAAFVEIGLDRAGFLGLRRRPAADDEEEPPPPVTVHEGESVIVQVQRASQGGKGAGLTLNLTLPGRYLVYAPRQDGIKISRRITDEAERARLADIMEGIADAGEGFILRTAAAGAAMVDLENDAAYLRELWAEVEESSGDAEAPALIFSEPDPIVRALRDRADESLRRIVIDDAGAFAAAKRYAERFLPMIEPLLEHDTDEEPLFERYGVEEAIDLALSPKVELACGGDVMIETTHALSAIDVNSGRHTGGANLAETILETNLEAAVEIARQVRLRNLAGLIVIDFIHMETEEHQARVLAAFEGALAGDPAFGRSTGFSDLGLVEISRRRGREPLAEMMTGACGRCQGSGSTLSPLALAYCILRDAALEAKLGPGGAITIIARPLVIEALRGAAGAALAALEDALGREVALEADRGYGVEQYDLVLD